MKLIDVDDEVTIAVTREELGLLASSIGEALEAVEDWEFSIRVGAQPEEARALRSTINDILRETTRPV